MVSVDQYSCSGWEITFYIAQPYNLATELNLELQLYYANSKMINFNSRYTLSKAQHRCEGSGFLTMYPLCVNGNSRLPVIEEELQLTRGK